LFVSGGFYKSAETLYLDKENLKNNRVTITTEDALTAVPFVSQGKPAEPLIIVDKETHHPLADDQIGEIWLDSPSVCAGYWQNPQATDVTFHAHIPGQTNNYLQTGDLGFIHRQQLYITGRTKDLIIIHGDNYYPHDIEYSVGHCHAKIRKGRVMALGVTVDLQERLVIIAEIYSTTHTKHDEILHAIKTNLSTNYSIKAHDIVLIKARQMPITTSGKISRSKGRQMYLNNEFNVVARKKTSVSTLRQKSDTIIDNPKPSTLIKSIVEEVIGQPIHNPRESLFTYHITSIEIAALIDRIEQAYDVMIPLQRITTPISIDSLQKLVQANHLTALAFQAKPLIDNYPLNLSASHKPRTFHYQPKTVLLSGADDFLGVHLLNKLLTCTELNIICFIPANQELPKQYLYDQLMKYDLHHAYDARRVTTVAVNFGKPRFGLKHGQLKEIIQAVDAIYHCAENSNWVLPLPLLEDVNTLATKQFIELFNLKKTVPIHYISTLVPFLFDLSGKATIYEEDYPQWENLLTGYNQSKWLSEQLLNQARLQYHIPINIYRMGIICNRPGNGRIKITDFLPRLLKTALQTNSLPLENTNMQLISIDYLSEWIVNISQHQEALFHNYHLLHQNKLTIDVLEAAIAHYLGPIKRVPYRQWVRRICEDKEIALYPLRPFLKMITPGLLADNLQIDFSNRNAEQIMRQYFPELADKEPDTEKILISLLDYLTEHHYL
jgi:thioester reductase-like protein